MIKKIQTNARINSRNDTNLKLFSLIKIAFNKINEIIEAVNRLERLQKQNDTSIK